MEKITDWHAVYNCLKDALYYFEGENSIVDSVRDLIVSLMDLVHSYM